MAVAAALTMVVTALYGEFSDGTTRYLKSLHADYWLMEPGSTSLGTASTIDNSLLPRIKSQPGVTAADGMQVYFKAVFIPKRPIGSSYYPARQPDGSFEYKKTKSAVIQSYQAGELLAPRLHSGRQAVGSREAVVDQTFASLLGLKLGQQFWIGQPKFLFTLVGTSSHTNSYVLRLVFVPQRAISDMTDGSNNYAAIPVRLDSSAKPAQLVSATGLAVLTNHRFIAANADYYGSFTLGPLGLAVILIAILSVLALSFKMSELALVQKRNLAILRASGWPARQIRRSFRAEMALLTLMALVCAIPIADVINLVVNSRIGLYGSELVVDVRSVVVAAVILLVILAIAPIRSLRQITKTDPALIFKAI